MLLADGQCLCSICRAAFHIGIAAGSDIMFVALICGFCHVLLNKVILSVEMNQDKFVFFLTGALILILLT
jgi:hypothetical protein